MKPLLLVACALCACGPKPTAAPAPVAHQHHPPRHVDVPPPADQPIDPLLVVERDATATYADPQTSSHFVTVVAELAGAHSMIMPLCGILHGGTVLDYKVLAVESGTLVGTRFLAAAGCVQMPREAYDTNAGTLDAFRTGDQHRLVLSNDLADSRGMSFIQTEPAFVIVSADPA